MTTQRETQNTYQVTVVPVKKVLKHILNDEK